MIKAVSRPLAAPALALQVICVGHVPAGADDLSALFDPGTIISVGGLVGAGQRFQGARRFGTWSLPYLSFRKVDEAPAWWSPDDGLDVTLAGTGAVQGGAVLDLRDARSARDTRRLPGLPTMPLTVGLGLFGEIWPIDHVLRLRAEVTQGVRAHDGVLAKFGADLIWHIGRLTLSGGPRLVLGDTAAQRLDFDVPIGTASMNGVSASYRAAAGLRSGGGTVALAYDWSEEWQSIGYIRAERYLASAAASPIVRRFGSETSVSVGVGAIRTFRVGE